MKWNKKWKKTAQPTKKRKYQRNAPLHAAKKMVSAHLSPELRKKYGTRSFPVRSGDKARVMRGDYKGTEGEVKKVDYKDKNVVIDKMKIKKKDGTKIDKPVHSSKIMITELNLDDEKRVQALKRRKK